MLNTILHAGQNFINKISEKIKKVKNNEVKSKEEISEITITVSQKQLKILEKLRSSVKTRADVRERANLIISLATKDINKARKEMIFHKKTIDKWVIKWHKSMEILSKVETSESHKLKSTISSILMDNYRSGKPPKIENEQLATIIFLSLQEPEKFDLPISNWTLDSLKAIAVKLEIIEENDISARQIGRYLRDMGINLHAYKEWLNSIESNPDIDVYMERVKKICDIYKDDELDNERTAIISTDEKTSIQAIEHKHPSKPAKIGKPKKIEQEYIRNGTTTLIASRDVNTGNVIPMLNPTRNETDFKKHIENVLENYKHCDKIIFIMDQLNTHKSESMVRLVAKECNITEDLGEKEKSGILKSMQSRMEFLENSSHKIQIVYTPKHCSWLNQIELWFGILAKQLLNRRVSFKSVEELNSKILEYIEYYNKNLAKKFKWNYSGKILTV